MNEEFRTVSMDLAASLVSQGLQCFIETFDGFQVEFVFPGDESTTHAVEMSQAWGLDDMMSRAKTLTVLSRRIRVESRRLRDQYSRERVPVRKEFKE